MKIYVNTEEWEIESCVKEEGKKSEEMLVILYQALEQDELEERQRGSGLPDDWQSRILRA